jgi:hypothetical protein
MSTIVAVMDLQSRHGRKFLKRVISGTEEWRLVALARNDWRVAFIRGTAEIVTSAIVSHEGETQPSALGAWLLHDDCKTAARLLLDGWRFRTREHRLESMFTMELIAVPTWGGNGLAIGGVTIRDSEWPRTLLGGACNR